MDHCLSIFHLLTPNRCVEESRIVPATVARWACIIVRRADHVQAVYMPTKCFPVCPLIWLLAGCITEALDHVFSSFACWFGVKLGKTGERDTKSVMSSVKFNYTTSRFPPVPPFFPMTLDTSSATHISFNVKPMTVSVVHLLFCRHGAVSVSCDLTVVDLVYCSP